MKRDKINYVVVGLFVLIMAIGLAIVHIILIGRTTDIDSYHIFFDNVTGIKEGTPVSYEGFQIGKIQDILPEQKNGKTQYIVKILVNQGWQIPQDSLAQINASGLLAQVSIDINEGESETFLNPGDEIKSTEALNVFKALGNMAQDVDTLTTDSIKPLMEKLLQGITVLAESFEKSAPHILSDLEGVTRKLNKEVLVDIQDTSRSLRESSELVKNILRPENQQQIELILDDFQVTVATFKDVSHKAKDISQDIDETNHKLDELLNESTAVVKENRDDIRRVITSLRVSLDITARQIDSISSNLERASRNMSEFSREIRSNPRLLFSSSPPKDRGAKGD